MKSRSLTNALLVCGLALLFSWVFFLLKHSPAFRDIIPFANDPYDAVGSFAFIAANLLAATSLVRVFLSQFFGSSGDSLYISRTQAAVSLCVLMTISADAIALLRHTSMWWGAPGEPAMLASLLCLLAASIGTLLLARRRSPSASPRRWFPASAVFLGTLLCLWLYPESLIDSTLTHLLTIDLGALLLFMPVTFFVLALLPVEPSTARPDRASRRRGVVPRWAVAALLGLAVGLSAFLAEIRETLGSIPFGRLVLLGSVYAWVGLSGLLIAYAFLRKPLGFLISD
jgi:hypothetical protein